MTKVGKIEVEDFIILISNHYKSEQKSCIEKVFKTFKENEELNTKYLVKPKTNHSNHFKSWKSLTRLRPSGPPSCLPCSVRGTT